MTEKQRVAQDAAEKYIKDAYTEGTINLNHLLAYAGAFIIHAFIHVNNIVEEHKETAEDIDLGAIIKTTMAKQCLYQTTYGMAGVVERSLDVTTTEMHDSLTEWLSFFETHTLPELGVCVAILSEDGEDGDACS